MKPYIVKRTLECAHHILTHHTTVRETAHHLKLGKSTVHTYLTKYLPEIDKNLSRQVERLLDVNRRERHIRGGESTKRKYAQSSSKV